jgi:glycosyltransferase involved in cell wall biosynthesis
MKATGGTAAPRVSFVVPAKNEAQTIELVLDEIARDCAGLAPFEVVYVDDGSTDNTQERLAAARVTRPWLRVLRHAESCGKSAALLTGARAARAPVVATLDGDAQNDPKFVPAMVGILERDPSIGLVAGQRLRRGESDNAFKKLQSRIANNVRKALLKDGTRDTACGLKVIRRDVLLSLPYFDTMHRFFPALVAQAGCYTAHIDVVDRPRLAGASHYGMFDRLIVGIPDLLGVWWLTQSTLPRAIETDVDSLFPTRTQPPDVGPPLQPPLPSIAERKPQWRRAVDLFGVAWLVRRRKRVPCVGEIW